MNFRHYCETISHGRPRENQGIGGGDGGCEGQVPLLRRKGSEEFFPFSFIAVLQGGQRINFSGFPFPFLLAKKGKSDGTGIERVVFSSPLS